MPASSLAADPWCTTQQSITGICMSPILNPTEHPLPSTNPNRTCNEDSASDNGSNFGEGNAYLLRQGSDDANAVKNSYDPYSMKYNGSYQGLYAQLNFD